MHVFQYWDSGAPPPDIAALLESTQMLNPNMIYQCFNHEQAAHFIREHFGPRHHAAFSKCAVPAMQADYFRYCAVLAKGGFYVDADFLCVGAVDSIMPGDADAVLFYRGAGGAVVNGIFGCRHPQNSMLAIVVEIATLNVETRLANSVWVTTGPGIFTVLHGIWGMTQEQRAAIVSGAVYKSNSSDPGPAGISEMDIARLIESCYTTIVRHNVDVDALFNKVALLRFPEDLSCCAEVGELKYKTTAVHWTNWPGNIFFT